MPIVFSQPCRVEWFDTDAAGIAHYGTFFRFMERTEHALLRSLGLSVSTYEEGKHCSWPRVSFSCDFSGAVKFEDVVDVELLIERLGAKSVSYQFRMTHAGQPVAMGRTVAVYCRLSDNGPPQSMPIPAPVVERLRPYVMETKPNSD
jgi:4-hydroxybenzoyl-CoA thioesterase/acyl-CoA thioester hydrolase